LIYPQITPITQIQTKANELAHHVTNFICETEAWNLIFSATIFTQRRNQMSDIWLRLLRETVLFAASAAL